MTRSQIGPIPLTVIGGYLGAGKTTVLNRLLTGDRRLGVIVNDFGELGIDAQLLAQDDGGVVNLPNGCICCTLGADLHTALDQMVSRAEPPEQIVIEASGIADPATVAAWSTVPPYSPGGVVVVAAADSVQQRADDRYVGGEVRRQLAAADLVIVSKSDLVSPRDIDEVRDWCRSVGNSAAVVIADHGVIPEEVVLGLRPDADHPRGIPHADTATHVDRYARWAWESDRAVSGPDLDEFLRRLPPELLRLKGFVALTDGSWVGVDVVGTRAEVGPTENRGHSQLEAIGTGAVLDLRPPG